MYIIAFFLEVDTFVFRAQKEFANILSLLFYPRYL